MSPSTAKIQSHRKMPDKKMKQDKTSNMPKIKTVYKKRTLQIHFPPRPLTHYLDVLSTHGGKPRDVSYSIDHSFSNLKEKIYIKTKLKLLFSYRPSNIDFSFLHNKARCFVTQARQKNHSAIFKLILDYWKTKGVVPAIY